MKTCYNCGCSFDDNGEIERQVCESCNEKLANEYLRLFNSGIDPETGKTITKSKEKIKMPDILIPSRLRQTYVDAAFHWLNKGILSKGKYRKRYFEIALCIFQDTNLKHHALVCRQLAQGKRYYPRLIRPSI